MKTYKVTVFIPGVVGDDSDPDSFKDTVKEALAIALDLDDAGEEELDFIAEEESGDDF